MANPRRGSNRPRSTTKATIGETESNLRFSPLGGPANGTPDPKDHLGRPRSFEKNLFGASRNGYPARESQSRQHESGPWPRAG